METTVHVLGIVGLALVMLIGVVLTALQLPGTWLVLAAAAGYDWWHGWQVFGPWMLVILAGLAVLGEILEQFTGLVTNKQVQGSRRAGIGGLIGGIVGMFVFTFPLPIIGTIAGGLVGCFLGALIAELTVRDDVVHSTRVGARNVIGRLLGMIAKLLICMAMAGLIVGLAIFGGPGATAL